MPVPGAGSAKELDGKLGVYVSNSAVPECQRCPDLNKSAQGDLEEARTEVPPQTSREVPKRTLKKRRPNSLHFRSLRCLLWGEQKATKMTKKDGEGFEFAVRGISIPQLF
jgi:hypothetical protein